MPPSAYRSRFASCRLKSCGGWRPLVLGALLALGLLALSCGTNSPPPRGDLLLATTTSVQDSGLLEALIPVFEADVNVNVKPIAVGTGAALRLAEDGNADALFVHAPDAERALVEAGDAFNRQLIAYNDFVIVGPPDDPAGIASAAAAAAALAAIAAAEADFISRGDDSGTHKRELAIWADVGIDPGGSWYHESGQGMGATITIADQRQSYLLADRATFLALSDGIDLVPLLEGDPALLNLYSVLQVSPAKPGVNALGAVAWIEFMLSDVAQAIIDDFRSDEFGRPLFRAAAGLSEEEVVERFAAESAGG